MRKLGENVIRIEAEALRALADRIAGPMGEAFEQVVTMLDACSGRVVVTGMGKSGIIARKIAATLSSTGTPSLFMHPSEALHGDLGMLVAGDVVIALSNSGETEEIVALLGTIKRLQVKLVTMTCDAVADPARTGNGGNGKFSTLASAADIALDCSIAQEACGMGLAPTASTTTMLALGDALALALAEKRGFREEDFANLHPGGKLGKKLSRVSQLMHSGDALPRVTTDTRMAQVIYEMSRKKLGMTTVMQGEKLVGIISDGDLRRLLEKHGHERDAGRSPANDKDVLDLTAQDCMTSDPKTVAATEFAVSALNMMERDKITFLVVVDENHHLQGIVHLHDLWGLESI